MLPGRSLDGQCWVELHEKYTCLWWAGTAGLVWQIAMVKACQTEGIRGSPKARVLGVRRWARLSTCRKPIVGWCICNKWLLHNFSIWLNWWWSKAENLRMVRQQHCESQGNQANVSDVSCSTAVYIVHMHMCAHTSKYHRDIIALCIQVHPYRCKLSQLKGANLRTNWRMPFKNQVSSNDCSSIPNLSRNKSCQVSRIDWSP